MVQVCMPNWLVEERKELATVIATINAELRRNPKMSLEEFARNLDKVLVEESYERIHKVVAGQFERA